MFGTQVASYHADVLSASPDTNDAKRALVTELKNRAKGALSSKVKSLIYLSFFLHLIALITSLINLYIYFYM